VLRRDFADGAGECGGAGAEALECYDAAIRADKRKTLAYLYKGAVCNRLERYAESVESYEQALKVERAGA
jgi:tetratricopeptide (TPR) repeat protein